MEGVRLAGGGVGRAGVEAASVAGGGCGDVSRIGRVVPARRIARAIWKSKINLSFLTHANKDEFAHKSFEIAACEGFLLVERSEGHLQRFVEDEEAVFFSTIEECAAKIRRYLPDEAARARIAAAGRARAERSGYHNDRQVGLIVRAREGNSGAGKGHRRLVPIWNRMHDLAAESLYIELIGVTGAGGGFWLERDCVCRRWRRSIWARPEQRRRAWDSAVRA